MLRLLPPLSLALSRLLTLLGLRCTRWPHLAGLSLREAGRRLTGACSPGALEWVQLLWGAAYDTDSGPREPAFVSQLGDLGRACRLFSVLMCQVGTGLPTSLGVVSADPGRLCRARGTWRVPPVLMCRRAGAEEQGPCFRPSARTPRHRLVFSLRSSVSGSQAAARPPKLGPVSVRTLECKWQKSAQASLSGARPTGLCVGKAQGVAGFWDGSSLSSVFRNPFVCDSFLCVLTRWPRWVSSTSPLGPALANPWCPQSAPLKPLTESGLGWVPGEWDDVEGRGRRRGKSAIGGLGVSGKSEGSRLQGGAEGVPRGCLSLSHVSQGGQCA